MMHGSKMKVYWFEY